ncbi:MAG TPA: GH-E family nuclease [Leptospiraceae bacterium]|nr:GH-E family nuclease [Leptospiraceae bacterium]HNO25817.1 GH-E family nuclease [Leptospiraceae bacterium]
MCPTCGKEVKGNPYNKERRDSDDGWDVDHYPKKWYERLLDRIFSSRKEVLDEYNNDTRLRCRTCNRSDNQ